MDRGALRVTDGGNFTLFQFLKGRVHWDTSGNNATMLNLYLTGFFTAAEEVEGEAGKERCTEERDGRLLINVSAPSTILPRSPASCSSVCIHGSTTAGLSFKSWITGQWARRKHVFGY